MRNITANLLSEVCKDVCVEPQLSSLSLVKRLSQNLQIHLPKLDWTLVLEECGPLANEHFST